MLIGAVWTLAGAAGAQDYGTLPMIPGPAATIPAVPVPPETGRWPADPRVPDGVAARSAAWNAAPRSFAPPEAEVPMSEVRDRLRALELKLASLPAYRPPTVVEPEQLTESTWYTRIDYFHWDERLDGEDFVNEDGPLMTLGYVRRVGRERFRGEVFGGNIGYEGGVDYEDGTSELLKSHTDYLGVRGEYDLLFEPDVWPDVSFFVGIGSRFWFRDLPDDYTASGVLVWGYEETWWTLYPYVGMERRRTLDDGLEFFFSGRIGSTVLTYQHVTWNDVTLYPKLGITGQLELGLRGRHLFLASFFEGLTWGESNIRRDSLQPTSRMVTVGLRAGLSF
jgi:hypothetical protein